MAKNPCCPLLLEHFADWCVEKLKESRIPAIAGMVFGLLAYMFAFTNKLINHDEAFTLFFKGGSFSLGRWGLEFLERIFPNYSMPWIYGIITIALITISVCVIIRIFSIRSALLQVLLAGLTITFPSLIGTMTYMFTVSSYAVSFLLAVTAVWLLKRETKIYTLAALVSMIASLSVYQSYVAIAASLLVLILVQQLLEGEKIDRILRRGIFYVLFLVASLGIYYGATMVINRLRGVGFNSYAGGNLSFSLLEIPQRIVMAYRNFPRFFTEGFRGLMPTPLLQTAHILCLILGLLLLGLWGFTLKKPEAPRLALLAALIAILPLAINCMYLFTTEDAVHTLVLYGFIAVYVLLAILADHCMPLLLEGKASLFRSLLLNPLALLLALIIAANTYIANQSYLMLHLRYENAYAFYTSLIADIRQMPEFDADAKLALIGTYRERDFYLEKFPYSDHLTGTDGFLPDAYSKDKFLEYYIGIPLPVATEEEVAAVAATKEVEAMAVYPYYGSIKAIGDLIVVKLS